MIAIKIHYMYGLCIYIHINLPYKIILQCIEILEFKK